MAKRIGISDKDGCTYCIVLKTVEDMAHILRECPALCRRRFLRLGEYYPLVERLRTRDFKDIIDFVNDIKCLEQVPGPR